MLVCLLFWLLPGQLKAPTLGDDLLSGSTLVRSEGSAV